MKRISKSLVVVMVVFMGVLSCKEDKEKTDVPIQTVQRAPITTSKMPLSPRFIVLNSNTTSADLSAWTKAGYTILTDASSNEKYIITNSFGDVNDEAKWLKNNQTKIDTLNSYPFIEEYHKLDRLTTSLIEYDTSSKYKNITVEELKGKITNYKTNLYDDYVGFNLTNTTIDLIFSKNFDASKKHFSVALIKSIIHNHQLKKTDVFQIKEFNKNIVFKIEGKEVYGYFDLTHWPTFLDDIIKK